MRLHIQSYICSLPAKKGNDGEEEEEEDDEEEKAGIAAANLS